MLLNHTIRAVTPIYIEVPTILYLSVAELRGIERHDRQQPGNQPGTRQGQDPATKDVGQLLPIGRSKVEVHKRDAKHRPGQALRGTNWQTKTASK